MPKPLALALAALLALFAAACSSAKPKEAEPEAAASTEPNLAFQARVRHPSGFDPQDLWLLFQEASAPDIASLEKCDFDYQAETMLARSLEELFLTLPAHVKDTPELYHWCFYAKFLKLEHDLEKEPDDDKRFKLVVSRYRFFVYVARIFETDFGDPRYLTFAIQNYTRLKRLYFSQAAGSSGGPQ